ncbi:MAG TPA: sensor domain-containing diguanylate cyclase [Rhodopila sp.]|nr:sensor domain-containing diguanylate cyclase [Rhodopila sp.]
MPGAAVAQPAVPEGAAAQAAVLVNGPLLSSRERWQDMVRLGADLAFETDAKGRFTFVVPDDALGWPAGMLVGQPADMLLLADIRAVGPNPFRPCRPGKAGRAWVRRFDGQPACLSFAATPLIDATGRYGGSRGIAFDVTEFYDHAAEIAGSLRRGEVLDFILWGVAQEVMAPRMMDAALAALINALSADGAAVIAATAGAAARGAAGGAAGETAGEAAGGQVLHATGPGPDTVWAAARELVARHAIEPGQAMTPDGWAVLAVGCKTRFDAKAAFVAWRGADPRPWDRDDMLLARSAGGVIRMILEHEAIQHEMARQARTDPLTGLLNRRAFTEELRRHVDRLDREELPGTLMFIDLDCFKEVNDRFGHEAGDQVLMQVATTLRELVRPSDLVARFGGDEFAVWMSGADHLTAAERAEYLRREAPRALNAELPAPVPGLGLSIGIATRHAGGDEPIDSVMRRADEAMYAVKRGGRGHWRVSLLED